MATKKTLKGATPKKAPGRPPKSADEKLEQFSVRLPPKLKFGLELLARAQHRSLSQAVEWALQRGLHTYEASEDGEMLGDVLDLVWPLGHEWDTLKTLRHRAPKTLSDDELWLWETISYSTEDALIAEKVEQLSQAAQKQSPPFTNPLAEANAYEKRAATVFDEFVRAYYPEIRNAVAERCRQGKPTRGVGLIWLVGMKRRHGEVTDDLKALVEAKQ